MKASERLAYKYLLGVGLGEVLYEPDGNVTPDFSVGGRIAVEVTRLNQNVTDANGRKRGLESASISLWQRLREMLREIAPSRDGECWYVSMRYRRPLPKWKQLEAGLRAQLGAFMLKANRSKEAIRIAPNFEIGLSRAGMDHGCFFVLGSGSDFDSGGWVMAEVEKNLRLCIAKKERTIAPSRSKYEEWWLVLEDHINYGMDSEDMEEFRSEIMPLIPHTFQRVVLLDPRDNGRVFEVFRASEASHDLD